MVKEIQLIMPWSSMNGFRMVTQIFLVFVML